MRARRLLILLLLVTLAALAAVGWGLEWRQHRQLEDGEFTRKRLAFLEAENHRLAALIDARQRSDADAAANAQRAEIERKVSELRALPFRERVQYRQIPRSQLPEILRQKLAQQMPEQEFGNEGIALAALGLLPHAIDLPKIYFALLGEQIGAFYDQHTKELYTFSGQPLTNAQNRVVLAHELTHALEDQQFNLLSLPLEAKGNDDRALASSALVEGDATLVMNQYMLGNLSASAIKDSLASAFTTDVRQLAAAPRYLRETLLFPYLHGLEFCQTLYNDGGWQALANAFAHPPTSTAEILHPQRFLDQPRQEPIQVAFSRTDVLGCAPLSDNVLGEFSTRQLLAAWLRDDQEASQAAEGWRGDRVLVYGSAAASSYIWRTCWADPQSAKRFLGDMARLLTRRYPDLAAHVSDAATGTLILSGSPSAAAAHTVMLTEGGASDITIIDAQDQAWFSALRKLASGKALP